jgi:hypothetical protein
MGSYGVVTCRFCKKKLPANEMLRECKRFFCSESCAREEGEHELADRVAEDRRSLLEQEALLRARAADARAAADADAERKIPAPVAFKVPQSTFIMDLYRVFGRTPLLSWLPAYRGSHSGQHGPTNPRPKLFSSCLLWLSLAVV